MEKNTYTNFNDLDDSYSLTLPIETVHEKIFEIVETAGFEPNGYFWERFVHYISPKLAEQVNFDSEAGMFCAYGTDRDALLALQTQIEAVVQDPALVAETITRGESEGFDWFD